MKRSAFVLCVVLVTIAAGLAACGGKSASPATSSGASATSGASTASGTPDTSAASPSEAAFQAYVGAVKPVIAAWQTAARVLRETLGGLDPQPGGSWDTAATKIAQQGALLTEASTTLGKVTTPATLVEATKKAVQSLSLQAHAARSIASLLATRRFKPGKIAPAVLDELNRSGQLQLAWIGALNGQAVAFGLPEPWPMK